LPPLVGYKTYVATTYEIGKMYGPGVPSRLPMDGAVALIMQTFLGPVSVGGSIGDAGHRKWYFQVGRMF
jgi:NTE family protein